MRTKYLQVWTSEIGQWDHWRLRNLRVVREQTHSFAGQYRATTKTALVNKINSDNENPWIRRKFLGFSNNDDLGKDRWFNWGDIIVEDKQAWMMIHPDGWIPVVMQHSDIPRLVHDLKPESERQTHGIADVGGHRQQPSRSSG